MGLQMSATGNGKLGRVLVVDDIAAVRKSIGMTLAHVGYEVVEAESGGQAIELMQDAGDPPVVDAVLCDIRMPSGSGVETIAFFRRQYPEIPVVALTAYPDVELAVSLMRQGVLDFLVKPVMQDELRMVVKRAVEQHAAAKDAVLERR